jgi:hypothetical protein
MLIKLGLMIFAAGCTASQKTATANLEKEKLARKQERRASNR